jgi:hypothetical protein
LAISGVFSRSFVIGRRSIDDFLPVICSAILLGGYGRVQAPRFHRFCLVSAT